jgi:hypothetical protein
MSKMPPAGGGEQLPDAGIEFNEAGLQLMRAL